MHYRFEWNPDKAKTNLQKHKISFERATEIFHDVFALSIIDEEHSDSIEERWITIGRDSTDTILTVVHIFRELDDDEWMIRIISARKSTKHEAQQYEGEDHAG